MDGLKVWKIFGEKYIVVRTSSIMSDGMGNEMPYLYLGYFVDADDKFMYLAPTCEKEKIVTAVEFDAIEEISIYSEEQENVREPGKLISIKAAAPETPPSQDPSST